MLTVKLIEHNGHEQIHEAMEVWSEPAPGGVTIVHARKPDGEALHFASYGRLYVMNDGGQTVASYHLGYGEDKSAA
jgi:hypothetical protein